MDKRRKKERRKRREQKVKSRVRAAQLTQAEGIGEETGPDSLFSLAAIRGKGAAARLDDASAPDFDAAPASSSSGGEEEEGGQQLDSEEEQRRWGLLPGLLVDGSAHFCAGSCCGFLPVAPGRHAQPGSLRHRVSPSCCTARAVLYRRYDQMMDEYLEESYQAWKTRQRVKGDVVKKKRRRLNDDGELTCDPRNGAGKEGAAG